MLHDAGFGNRAVSKQQRYNVHVHLIRVGWIDASLGHTTRTHMFVEYGFASSLLQNSDT